MGEVWKGNFENLGPLHVKAKPVKFTGKLPKKSNPGNKLGQAWKGDFSNLGPLAQKVKPMFFKLPGS